MEEDAQGMRKQIDAIRMVAWAEWLEYDAAKSRVNASASWNRECNGSLKHGMKGVELRGTKENKFGHAKRQMRPSPS